MRERKRLFGSLAALVVAASLVTAPVGAQDIERVKENRDALEAEIADVTDELESLRGRIHQARESLAALAAQVEQLEAQEAEAHEALLQRARTAFMRGGEAVAFESLLESDGPQAAAERAGFLAALSRRDVAALQNADALRTQIAQTRELLAAKKQQFAALEGQLEERGAALQERFERAAVLYRELKARKDRQTRIMRGAQRGIYACIFQGPHHFSNTWGAARSGGRRHKGTDVMAAFGAPVYAFTNGRIAKMSYSGLGGIGLYLWGDDGVEYYYAHLDGHAAGMYVGRRVEAGELVGYNGSSGNADRWAPHVHFEVHPGGGGAVNPYYWLSPVC
ncbi:MAG: murein hydrolase activator EnvC family protein [Nitriliruptorales bacterium]